MLFRSINWLNNNYPMTSWVIPAHPERKGRWKISDFREMNDIAPMICFGFEGIPGHQKSKFRGEYGPDSNTYGNHTYGGAGYMSAKIGGVWDALLSEGRNWWLFSCSDFHNLESDFFPGEYNKTYLYMPENISYSDIIDCMRSGNCFVVNGDFVSDMHYSIDNALMGETCFTNNDSINIIIRIKENPNSKVKLNNLDIIEGIVSDKAIKGTDAYESDTVCTTNIIATFNGENLVTDKSGYITINYKTVPSSENTYYRIRATNHTPDTPGFTD